jgi:hypothetical protein
MMTIIGLMTTIINNIEALFRGRLYSEATAGRVYDEAAKEAYADFALLNFPGQQLPQQLQLPI